MQCLTSAAQQPAACLALKNGSEACSVPSCLRAGRRKGPAILHPSHCLQHMSMSPPELIFILPQQAQRHGGARAMSSERVHGDRHLRQPAAGQPAAAHLHSGHRRPRAALLRPQHLQPAARGVRVAASHRHAVGGRAGAVPAHRQLSLGVQQRSVALRRAALLCAACVAHRAAALQRARPPRQQRLRHPAADDRRGQLLQPGRRPRLSGRRGANILGSLSPTGTTSVLTACAVC